MTSQKKDGLLELLIFTEGWTFQGLNGIFQDSWRITQVIVTRKRKKNEKNYVLLISSYSIPNALIKVWKKKFFDKGYNPLLNDRIFTPRF